MPLVSTTLNPRAAPAVYRKKKKKNFFFCVVEGLPIVKWYANEKGQKKNNIQDAARGEHTQYLCIDQQTGSV